MSRSPTPLTLAEAEAILAIDRCRTLPIEGADAWDAWQGLLKDAEWRIAMHKKHTKLWADKKMAPPIQITRNG